MVTYKNHLKSGNCYAAKAADAKMFCGDESTVVQTKGDNLPEWLPSGVSEYKLGTGRADVFYNRLTGEYARQHAPGYSFNGGLTAEQAKQY